MTILLSSPEDIAKFVILESAIHPRMTFGPRLSQVAALLDSLNEGDILNDLVDSPMGSVYLKHFGGTSRGVFTRYSDIDFLLVFQPTQEINQTLASGSLQIGLMPQDLLPDLKTMMNVLWDVLYSEGIRIHNETFHKNGFSVSTDLFEGEHNNIDIIPALDIRNSDYFDNSEYLIPCTPTAWMPIRPSQQVKYFSEAFQDVWVNYIQAYILRYWANKQSVQIPGFLLDNIFHNYEPQENFYDGSTHTSFVFEAINRAHSFFSDETSGRLSGFWETKLSDIVPDLKTVECRLKASVDLIVEAHLQVTGGKEASTVAGECWREAFRISPSMDEFRKIEYKCSELLNRDNN